ncbi:MAG: glutathione S-transferase family protein [Rhodospirillales bacterium]|jgi:glutathione S-transferase
MKLHHAPGSRSTRIVWLLEELALPYEIQFHKLGDRGMRSPEYLKVHPMGRVPALEDADTVIHESGAIVEYILTRYGGGRMRPDSDSTNFAQYLQWLHYSEGMMMPQVNVIMVETFFLPPERRNEVNVERANKLLTRSLDAVELQLAEGGEFLAGDFSGADIMTGHACIVAKRLEADMTDKPNVNAYVERLTSRAAYQKAVQATP